MGWLSGRAGPLTPVAVLRLSNRGELQISRARNWVTIPLHNTPLDQDTMYDRTPEVEALAHSL